ncbi:hypothetical protein ACOTHJ_13320 [Achromobacter xylosoxidans]|uniref:hypothetical protein n=1 Tax=Achromobacter anxifer TaxID=1287737 RepID=UPI00155BA762|nr:hypothetical protein [Achromobacter anxifer]CAB5514670.1 hypothetical protein LMG26857_03729 [Achromobacter anxifer]
MTTISPNPSFDSAVRALVTPARLAKAFEAVREPTGACTIERLPVFLKKFMSAFRRGTGRQAARLPYGREEIAQRAEEIAAKWFKSNCTSF